MNMPRASGRPLPTCCNICCSAVSPTNIPSCASARHVCNVRTCSNTAPVLTAIDEKIAAGNPVCSVHPGGGAHRASTRAAAGHSSVPASTTTAWSRVVYPSIIRSIRAASSPMAAKTISAIGSSALRGIMGDFGCQRAGTTTSGSRGMKSNRAKRSGRAGPIWARRVRNGAIRSSTAPRCRRVSAAATNLTIFECSASVNAVCSAASSACGSQGSAASLGGDDGIVAASRYWICVRSTARAAVHCVRRSRSSRWCANPRSSAPSGAPAARQEYPRRRASPREPGRCCGM